MISIGANFSARLCHYCTYHEVLWTLLDDRIGMELGKKICNLPSTVWILVRPYLNTNSIAKKYPLVGNEPDNILIYKQIEYLSATKSRKKISRTTGKVEGLTFTQNAVGLIRNFATRQTSQYTTNIDKLTFSSCQLVRP